LGNSNDKIKISNKEKSIDSTILYNHEILGEERNLIILNPNTLNKLDENPAFQLNLTKSNKNNTNSIHDMENLIAEKIKKII